jgi:hypothetical protein
VIAGNGGGGTRGWQRLWFSVDLTTNNLNKRLEKLKIKK